MWTALAMSLIVALYTLVSANRDLATWMILLFVWLSFDFMCPMDNNCTIGKNMCKNSDFFEYPSGAINFYDVCDFIKESVLSLCAKFNTIA